MPITALPPSLAGIGKTFTIEQKQFTKSTEGIELQKGGTQFSREFRPGARFADIDSLKGGEDLINWVGRLPDKFVQSNEVPVLDFSDPKNKTQSRALSDGLQILTAGSAALLGGSTTKPELAGEAILAVAFGTDRISTDLRKVMVDSKFPWPLPIPLKNMPNIEKLVRDGTVRELLSTFARCGAEAQAEREWSRQVRPIGKIDRLSLATACAGDELQITFSGFGASQPSEVADVMISLPSSSGGCTHISLRKLNPNMFAGGWRDTGDVKIKLPKSIWKGCIGFFTLPPPITAGGSCGAGDLLGAAGMLQSVLGDQLGGWGVLVGQTIVDIATKVEAGRMHGYPCADCQADRANHLEAGPPRINGFRIAESGPVFPRGTITLVWSVENATQVQIVERSVTGSENAHELPAIGSVNISAGRMAITVTCTRRWEAQYVLIASNNNGCSREPIEASVPIESGYSEYLVGVGKADVTDARPGLPMAGFAYKQQKTSGDIDLRQFARAFVIEENSLDPQRKRLAIVVADIWTCTQALKLAVLNRINAIYPSPRYTEETLLVAGTHTHSGPGGYSEYALYNLTIGGFDQGVFDTIVNGIVSALANAGASKRRGRIFVNSADLADCGTQRSIGAFRNNPEYDANDRSNWTDREMLLLRFATDENNRGEHTPIGALNWFAIHPTSLGMYNRAISGDSKGWAAKILEDKKAGNFVAAFGNGSAGDISGNLELDANENPVVFKPLGGPGNTDELDRNKERMHELARLQADGAFALLSDNAAIEVTGPLAAKHAFVDMSNTAILSIPNARTWPAALGVSFGAGSSEDSIAFATLGTTDIDARIIEGMTMTDMVLGGVVAVPAVIGLGVAVAASVGALLGGVALAPLMVPIVLGAIGTLAPDGGRSFLAATVAASLFPGEMDEQTPQPANGPWKWEVPAVLDLPANIRDGHLPKPIMFPVGSTFLKFTPTAGSMRSEERIFCPMVPNVNPVQLMRIGNVAIAAVPAEFTATSGRRLKQTLAGSMGPVVSHIAICGYSNGYSGYVTTEEEYRAQHYEGASTLYGPHTLAAYMQHFGALADALINNTPTFGWLRFTVPAVFPKP